MPEGGVLITCEHARPDVPRSVQLGLDEGLARSCLAYEPGAMELAQILAMRLGAPLVMGQVSRLVVDLSLAETHPECVPDVLRDTPIPGNLALTDEQRAGRIAVFHRPYRRAVLEEIEEITSQGRCVHVSVHTFSPAQDGVSPDLEVQVCYDPARLGEQCWGTRILAALRDARFEVRAHCTGRRRVEQRGEPAQAGCSAWLRDRYDDDAYAGLELKLSRGMSPERQQRAVWVASNALRTATSEGAPCC